MESLLHVGFHLGMRALEEKYAVFERKSTFCLNWILRYSWGKGTDEEVILNNWRFERTYFFSQKEQACFVLP